MNPDRALPLWLLFWVLSMAYGVVQLIVGYHGIAEHLGNGWALGALVAAFGFRFTLPITIGSFFGAMDLFGWPWYGALLFAAPGLLFLLLLLPGALSTLLGKLR